MKLELKLVSALEKVFLDEAPAREAAGHSALRNELSSFQAAFILRLEKDEGWRDTQPLRLEIESPLKECVRVRRVVHVPVRMSSFRRSDEDYLRPAPGLFPDLLQDLQPHAVKAFLDQWDTLWFDVDPQGRFPAGEYPITIRLFPGEENVREGMPDPAVALAEATYTLTIIGADLPKQTLRHTKWLHTDCLADWYRVPVFSEEYWRIVENYMANMAARGINTVLTPIHTPPLDTRVGGERPTVQLVDVFCDGGKWSFGFEKLDRWVETARRAGIEYFEMAHFFTQWGARFAPKIVARVDGERRRVFGWDTDGTGEEYAAFLREYVPALCARLRALGVFENCYFHISDEPSADHLEGYIKAKEIVKPLLGGGVIIDALSDVSFYLSGAVEKPVPAVNHIVPFLEANVPGLWCYYCIGQNYKVANIFIGMPSYRNRVYAEMLYKYDIEGILQWGYNFWYAQYSDYQINPFIDTESDGFSLSGDAFQVYPGRDGAPVDSIRHMVSFQALEDLRAMRLLESLAGREAVLALIDGGLETGVTFDEYPRSAQYLLDLREKINREIAARV